MKKIPLLVVCLGISFAFIVSGCKKENEKDYDTQSSVDHAQAERIFNEIHEIADQAVIDGELSTHRFGNESGNELTSCATITVNIDSANGSGSAVITFGSFCLGIDSVFRKGTINVSFNGPYRNQGTVITITTTDFRTGPDSAHATKVIGERIVTNNGPGSSGHLNYAITVNATLVNYLNDQMKWHSSRNREWVAGDTSAVWSDDEYLITGSGSGRSFSGLNYDAEITQALRVKGSCRWITEGKFTLMSANRHARYFDFGTGSCDDKATLIFKDETYQITLK